MASRYVDHAINFEHSTGARLAEIRQEGLAGCIPKHFFTALGECCFLALYPYEGAMPLYNVAHANFVSGDFIYRPRTQLDRYRQVARSTKSLNIIGQQIAQYYLDASEYVVQHEDVLYIPKRDARILGAQKYVDGNAGVVINPTESGVYHPLVHLNNVSSEGMAHNIRWETPFEAPLVHEATMRYMTQYYNPDEQVYRLFDASSIIRNEASIPA